MWGIYCIGIKRILLACIPHMIWVSFTCAAMSTSCGSFKSFPSPSLRKSRRLPEEVKTKVIDKSETQIIKQSDK